MAFMNEKSTIKLAQQNQFWANVRDNTNGKKVLVIHDYWTALIMSVKNEVFYITDDEEKKKLFIRSVINNVNFGNDDKVELIEDWKNFDKIIEKFGFGENMKFDLIIGNPPYDGHTKLYLLVLNKVKQYTSELVWICPTLWVDRPFSWHYKHKEIIQKAFEQKLAENIIEGKFFEDQGIPDIVGIFHWKEGVENINLYDLWKRHYAKPNLIESIFNKFEKTTENSMKQKMIRVTYNVTLKNAKYNYGVSFGSYTAPKGKNPTLTDYAIVKGISKKNHYWKYDKILKACSTTKRALDGDYRGQHDLYFIPFDTEIECNNFIEYMKLNIVKFAWYSKKLDVGITPGDVDFIPWLDFSKSISDTDLKKQFNFTKEEYNYICEEMKPYK